VASGQARRVALVAATAADARDVLIEGQSGILAVSPTIASGRIANAVHHCHIMVLQA